MSRLIVKTDFIIGLDNLGKTFYNWINMKFKKENISLKNNTERARYEFKNFGKKEFAILMKKNLQIPVSTFSL